MKMTKTEWAMGMRGNVETHKFYHPKFLDNFNFLKYVNYALSVPMYFVRRDNQYIDCTGESFNDFIKGKMTKVSTSNSSSKSSKSKLKPVIPLERPEAKEFNSKNYLTNKPLSSETEMK